MKYLKDREESEALGWMKEAGKVAEKGRCLKALNGTVIVKDGKIIGSGYSGPALDDESNRTCNDDDTYDYSIKPRFDRTCCIHAEWRAIIDALKTHPIDIQNSKLYYCGVDNEGNIKKSGKPYCTVCSRLALESGIGTFVLWHEDGICEYPTDEYNKLSYSYLKKL
jgi:deoxycytidylate deaminase